MQSFTATNEPSNGQENVDPNVVQQITDFLNAAQLKKKEVQSKNSKRAKSWIDKLQKGKRKSTKSSTSTKGVNKQKKNDALQPHVEVKNDAVQPHVEVENDGSKKGAIVVHDEYNVIGSFTQLLTAPGCDDDSLYDGNLF